MSIRAPIVFAALLFGGSACFAQSSQVSYQGELKKDGSLYNGIASMKFAIISSGQTLWSNDGTSIAGGQPSASVSVTVTAGIFGLGLGVSPMGPIDAGVMQGVSNALLRVWVDTGQGFEQLTDQPISSSVFSLAASKLNGISTTAAGNVGIGTATPGERLHVYSDTDCNVVVSGAGSINYATLNLNSSSSPHRIWQIAHRSDPNDLNKLMYWYNDGSQWNPVATFTPAGNLGIGTKIPAQKLTVAGTIESTSGGVKFPDGTIQATAQLVGPPGARGPQGEQGEPGPQGPAVSTSAVCVADLGSPSTVCGLVCHGSANIVANAGAPCFVTSDTGSCSRTTGTCCVCKP